LEHFEAIIQVFTKFSFPNVFGEIAIGGRDDSDIYLVRFGTAEALKFTLLQNTEQLGLDFHRNLADLIEENSRIVGSLKTTDLAG